MENTVAKNKRNSVKWVRDFCKSNYKKASVCAICGSTTDLEFHHYHSVSLIVENYAKENDLDFSNEEVVLANREDLLNKRWHELVKDAVTLCRPHHLLLHKIYGEIPPLHTADKQKNWVLSQFNKKHNIQKDVGSSDLTKYCTKSQSFLDFIYRED